MVKITPHAVFVTFVVSIIIEAQKFLKTTCTRQKTIYKMGLCSSTTCCVLSTKNRVHSCCIPRQNANLAASIAQFGKSLWRTSLLETLRTLCAANVSHDTLLSDWKVENSYFTLRRMLSWNGSRRITPITPCFPIAKSPKGDRGCKKVSSSSFVCVA